MQWLIRCGLAHLRHVLVNMDETSVSRSLDVKRGWLVDKTMREASRLTAGSSRVPWHIQHCSLLAAVSPCPGLQPQLPQVLLCKSRGGREPPRHVLEVCAGCGSPLEFWHGSNGWVDYRIMRHYVTRLRSAVQSAAPGTWTVLLVDCASPHLDRRTVQHMRRLGVVPLFVPAGLTWLLQPADVGVFRPLKEALRSALLSKRLENEGGTVAGPEWLRCISAAVHGVVVNVDWAESFEAVGASPRLTSLNRDVANLLSAGFAEPRLPSLEDFAFMVGRPANSANTRQVYESVLAQHLELQNLLPGSLPPAAALEPRVELPPAQKRRRVLEAPAGESFAQDLRQHLQDRYGVRLAEAPDRGAARNFTVPDLAVPA